MKKLYSLIAVLFLITTSSIGQSISNNTISVQGYATVSQIPENMEISIPITVKEIEYSTCNIILTKNYNEIIKALSKKGFDKKLIKTTQLSIQENYEYSSTRRKQEFKGYIGKINVSVVIPYSDELLNNLIKVMSQRSSNNIFSVSFELSNKQKEKLKTEAIQLAIDDATKTAEIITSSANLTLSKIIKINYNTTNDRAFNQLSQNSLMEYKTNSGISLSDISLNPKPVEIKKTIEMVWEIESK